MWLFGYGSLVWKVDFPYKRKLLGYVKGYDRRFWEASIFHRGTLEKPGRTVTLVPAPEMGARVYGVAYEIPDDDKRTIASINTRELGLAEKLLTFYPLPTDGISNATSSTSPVTCMTYVSTLCDTDDLSPDSLEEMVEQIAAAKGTSGPNSEYVYQLADWHRQHFPGVEDEHLFQIDSELRKLLNVKAKL